MGTAFLGEPPSHIKEWIRKHHKQSQFKFLYKKAGDADWQEWEPQPDDIQIVDGKVTIMATSFKSMGGFADVKEVKLPNKLNNGIKDVDVTSIGEEVFYNCSALINIMIPDSVVSIGDSAFYNCSGLTSVTIPNSVAQIGEEAFYGCSRLMSISVGIENANYKSVNGMLLSKDSATLVAGVNGYVNIPDNVTSIGYSAFGGCSGLKRVMLPDSIINIRPHAFENCSELTSMMIPNSVTSIGNDVFHNCRKLRYVTISNSLTSIEIGTFENCSSLTSITIPDSVANIEYRTFQNCSKLASIAFKGDAPTVGTNAFNGVAFDCKAVISSTATGFPAAGETWNGLIVEVKE